MSDTGFSTSSGIGGNEPGRDYAPAKDSQPTATDSGVPAQTNLQGGVGDRTQGAGKFGGSDVQQPSTGDQYGSSGGYGSAPGKGQGDALDKGVDFLEKKSGHQMVRPVLQRDVRSLDC